jgi:hypothetical protein
MRLGRTTYKARGHKALNEHCDYKGALKTLLLSGGME